MRRRGTRGLWVAVILAVTLLSPGVAAADWQHPVEAEVTDTFRPPTTRFGRGNRGLEYGTVGGEVVSAADAGVVTFAGSVGSARHVVVDHGEGLRSTYAYVDRIDVVRGQSVRKGQRLATASVGFHLTARLGDVYVDPMLLIRGAEVVPRLRPGVDPPATAGTAGRELSPFAALLDAAGDLTLTAQIGAIAEATGAWLHSDCTADGVRVASAPGATPPSDRVLVQVGGLGTSSEGASIGGLDHGALGYDPNNVVGFSYDGGCTPAPFGHDTAAPGTLTADLSVDGQVSAYEPAHTLQPVEQSARHLADLVEEVAAARPGAAIDIAAHSLGGVVSRRALEILDERGSVDLVGLVVTIGSPHTGADLATAGVAVAGSEPFDALFDAIGGDVADFHDADSVLDIAEAGGGGIVDPGPPPDGVTVVAVAGATDLVVPAGHAIWDGATNVVVPTGVLESGSVHGNLPSMPEVQREVELALAGAPPRCVSLADAIGSSVKGQGISAIEDGLTLLTGLTRWAL